MMSDQDSNLPLSDSQTVAKVETTATSVGERASILVGIATAGRRDVLSQILPLIGLQTRLPDRLIVSVGELSDVDEAIVDALPCPAEIVLGPKGLTRQRNRIMDSAGDAQIVVFLDDDFLMHPTFLEETERLFLERTDCVIATGEVVADGILGPGFELAKARSLQAEDLLVKNGKPHDDVRDVYNAYGCNMAIRMEPVRRTGVCFDVNLPYYGWLEDLDFSRQLADQGRILRSNRLRGVHMGTKQGRSPGLRLGYSQIANPYYLVSKRTMSFHRAVRLASRNFAANLIKSLRPEPWIDRKGRLRGNVRALADILFGRIAPGNVLKFD